jgi:hypothetical protein
MLCGGLQEESKMENKNGKIIDYLLRNECTTKNSCCSLSLGRASVALVGPGFGAVHFFSCVTIFVFVISWLSPMAHEPLPIEGVASCVLAAWHRLPLIDRVRGVSTEDDAALVRSFMSPPPEETDERQPDLTLESLFGWLFATDIPHGGLTFLAEPQGSTEKAAVWRALSKPLVRAVKAQDNARPKYGQFIHHPPPVASVKLMLQTSQPDIILGVLRVARVARVCASVGRR